jgi:hypothetical protein
MHDIKNVELQNCPVYTHTADMCITSATHYLLIESGELDDSDPPNCTQTSCVVYVAPVLHN